MLYLEPSLARLFTSPMCANSAAEAFTVSDVDRQMEIVSFVPDLAILVAELEGSCRDPRYMILPYACLLK
jgi:hypothetical protein